MPRPRKPLSVIDIDDEEEMDLRARAAPKIDQTAVARKKAQTPKKRAAPTPRGVPADIKPKLEPESPIQAKIAPKAKSKRAVKPKAGLVQPKTEPDLEAEAASSSIYSSSIQHGGSRNVAEEDIKPDVRALESLLDGLNLERSNDGDAAAAHSSQMSRSPSPSGDRPATPDRPRSSTPLFIPYDSPESPIRAPSNPSPISTASSTRSSPRMRAQIPIAQAPRSPLPTNAVDPFDLFSSDSPPPPPVRQSHSSYASSSGMGDPAHDDYSDEEYKSPVAGPSRSRSHFGSSDDTSPKSRRLSDFPKTTSCNKTTTEDVKPSLEILEDINPTTASLTSATPSSKPRRRAFLDFLETVAKADSEEDEYEYQLNESEGSLRDFIVDDDEVSYLSDSEGSMREIMSEEEDSDIVEVKVDRSHVYGSDGDSDFMVEEAVSHPKIGKAADLDFLDDFEDSDQDVVERDDAEDLLDAIHNLTIATPSTKAKKGKKAAKAPKWAEERVRIAQEVFDDLDKRVFDNQLGAKGAGAKIGWNKRLLTTAGTAQRKRRRHPGGESTWEVAIQLSEKVCTGEEQILSTVAHEMCHLACWVIDKEFKNPHGKVFKSWGRKVMRKRNDLEVTTKHDYVIEYKYEWRCVDCRKVYKRHSKSIDIEKQGCGICKGKLEPLFETKSRGTSTFQVYLKQNMKLAKAALPGASHGEVMRALSARWAEAGPEADHESHWKAVLAATKC